MNTIHATFAAEGLVRPREGRVLGGVVAGLGRRFGIDPWPARLLFVLLLMVIPGSQILIYPLLWILMPSEGELVPAGGPAPAGPPPTSGPTGPTTSPSWPAGPAPTPGLPDEPTSPKDNPTPPPAG